MTPEELLKEVGEPINACPVGVALNAVSHVGAANYDHREREARRWIYEAEKQLYTSDQLVAAVLKATKPLEEEVEFQRTAHNRAMEMMLEQGAQLQSAQDQVAAMEEILERQRSYFDAHQNILMDEIETAEQRVAELIGELEHTREQKNLLWFEFSITTQKLAAAQEQIANETAEACARICDYKHNQPVELIEVAKTQSECAEAIRSGAWKEFKNV